jgi:hypothetical protein
VVGLLLEVRTSEQLLQQQFQLPSLCESILGSQMFAHLWLLLTWIEVHEESLHKWDGMKADSCLASEHKFVTESCKEAASLQYNKKVVSVIDKAKKKHFPLWNEQKKNFIVTYWQLVLHFLN